MVQSVLFSPVTSGMAWSSLGFNAAYGGLAPCEWAAMPEKVGAPPRSSVTGRVLSEFDCVYVSVSWELELPVLVNVLRQSGIEPRRALRPASDPLIISGGPQTLSNPDALAAVSDAVLVGDADGEFESISRCLEGSVDRDDALFRLAAIDGMWVPAVHGPDAPRGPRRALLDDLPARTVLLDGPNLFGNAFLVEAGRGCPRACTFCVARSGAGKTLFVPPSGILDVIPAGAVRVGLVGAAVSDHPRLPEVVEALVSRKVEVTLSSIRADRATPELLGLLSKGGLRTLTVGADGVSDGIRSSIRKGISTRDLVDCAETARLAGIRNIRLYVMVGLPGETDDDLEEFACLVRSMSKRASLSISVSPFVPKKSTPLAGAPFAGTAELKRKVSLLKRGVQGTARFRSASPRTALAEWRLSHAGVDNVFEIMRESGLDRE